MTHERLHKLSFATSGFFYKYIYILELSPPQNIFKHFISVERRREGDFGPASRSPKERNG